MGVFKRKSKDGTVGETWCVDYRDPAGKRIIKAVGPSKREAEDCLPLLEAHLYKSIDREGSRYDSGEELRCPCG